MGDAELRASGMSAIRVIECRSVFSMLTRNSGRTELTVADLKKFFSGFPSGPTNVLKEATLEELGKILVKTGAPPPPEGEDPSNPVSFLVFAKAFSAAYDAAQAPVYMKTFEVIAGKNEKLSEKDVKRTYLKMGEELSDAVAKEIATKSSNASKFASWAMAQGANGSDPAAAAAAAPGGGGGAAGGMPSMAAGPGGMPAMPAAGPGGMPAMPAMGAGGMPAMPSGMPAMPGGGGIMPGMPAMPGGGGGGGKKKKKVSTSCVYARVRVRACVWPESHFEARHVLTFAPPSLSLTDRLIIIPHFTEEEEEEEGGWHACRDKLINKEVRSARSNNKCHPMVHTYE